MHVQPHMVGRNAAAHRVMGHMDGQWCSDGDFKCWLWIINLSAAGSPWLIAHLLLVTCGHSPLEFLNYFVLKKLHLLVGLQALVHSTRSCKSSSIGLKALTAAFVVLTDHPADLKLLDGAGFWTGCCTTCSSASSSAGMVCKAPQKPAGRRLSFKGKEKTQCVFSCS